MSEVISWVDWERRFSDFLDAQAEGDVAHDRMHIHRVVRMARQLAEAEQAELRVVIPAAWLHDCIGVPKTDPRRAQTSQLAAEHAITFLMQAGYPAVYAPAIAHAIEAHSFSAGIPPHTLEARVVQDADRLDAIGAIGLSRFLMLAGTFRSTLYHPTDPFCQTRLPEDTRFAVDHLYAKLFKLPGLMQTEAGKAEAQRRIAFMERYISQLGEEIGA